MKVFLMWLYKLPGNTNLFKPSRLDRYSKHNIQMWATGMLLFHHTYDCRFIENSWGNNRLWVLKLKICFSLKIWKTLNIFHTIYYFIGKWFFFLNEISNINFVFIIEKQVFLYFVFTILVWMDFSFFPPVK